MGFGSTRVVHPFPKRGLYLANVALGGFFGLFFVFAAPAISESITEIQSYFSLSIGNWLGLWGQVFIPLILFLPQILWFVALGGLLPRAGEYALASVCFASASLISGVAGSQLIYPEWCFERLANPWGLLNLYPAIGVLAMVAFLSCLAIAMACHVGTRWFRFRPIEQTGTLCWRCGYDRTEASIKICPECGVRVWLAKPRGWGSRAWVGAILRAARPLLMILGVVFLSLCVRWVVTGVLPAIDLMHMMTRAQPGVKVSHVKIMNQRTIRQSDGASVTTWTPEFAFALPTSERDERLVSGRIAILNDQRVLRLLIVPKPAANSGDMVYPAAFEVSCNLTARQTDWAIHHGVPAALTEALVEASKTSNWIPPPSIFTGVPTQPDPARAVRVDPAPFFPEELRVKPKQ